MKSQGQNGKREKAEQHREEHGQSPRLALSSSFASTFTFISPPGHLPWAPPSCLHFEDGSEGGLLSSTRRRGIACTSVVRY